MKKILALILSLTMLLSLSIPAFAVSKGAWGTNMAYEVTDKNELILWGEGVMPDENNFALFPFWDSRNWTKYTALEVRSGVTTLASQLCFEMKGLTRVSLPDTLTTIGDWAFYSTWALENITIPNSVIAIGDMAFRESALKELVIPDSVVTLGEETCLFCDDLTKVVFGDGVVEIPARSFQGCDNLTNVTLGDSVQVIGPGAFASSPLDQLTLPASVTTIGHQAFAGTDLTTLTIPAGVTTIQDGAFINCTKLTDVTILGQITNINDGTFSGCTSLKTITIPATVNTIEDNAFQNCTSLTDVYFGGTELEWKAIAMGKGNEMLQNPFAGATIHFGSDTPTAVFNDVPAGLWYTDPVTWAVKKGITNGTSTNPPLFSPDQTCTTAHIITFLHRALGSPAPSVYGDPFFDVDSKDYYGKAAEWAWQQKLVSGGYFYPDSDCTRANVVTYLWKLAGSPDAQGSTFSDVTGDDLTKAVAWAVDQKITNGTGGGKFSPDDTCTRGEIVTFLYRAYA